MIYENNSAWRNGKFCKVKDLNVNILDLGMIHADATYDVIAVRNNKPFKIDEHLDRFLSSCEYWRIPMKWYKEQLREVIKGVHHYTGWDDSIIWLSASRGIPKDGNPRNLSSCETDVICYAKPYQKFNGTNKATVCSAETVKRVPSECIDQRFKNWAWPDLTRAQWEAVDKGFDTAVLFSIDGFLTEGPGFNVAIIKDNVIYAPQKDVLPGISMLAVKEICDKLDINFQWKDISYEEVKRADDMFLTTTIGNIVTVTNYNGRKLKISPIQQLLIENLT